MKNFVYLVVVILLSAGCADMKKPAAGSGNMMPGALYQYSGAMEPRWVSFENIKGEKGRGGMENNGAKGHPSDVLKAGETKKLLDIKGPGIINRIWVTINDRSPEMLRSLVLKMYWDDSQKPAVSVPFGDFFGIGLGKTAVYQNALFANPEGRSFNCFIQMPFRTAAKVELVNESSKDLAMLFYDIDLQLLKDWDESFMYFHCFWHRDTATTLSKDFEIMPKVNGKGRFLGSNISVHANPAYRDCWWGEGEVKVYLDGDGDYPTLTGTGTEDYIGTAWGQGQFYTNTTGCLVADPKNLQWAFYRFHINDAVYFGQECRVTIQQIGGNTKNIVVDMMKHSAKLIPITTTGMNLYEMKTPVDLSDPSIPDNWTNFYRSDDLSAACYFYLNTPANDLPDLQSTPIRTYKLVK
jgi:hypothetical protein